MASRLDPLYARAPLLMQNAMVSAFGAVWYWRRFGPGFKRELDGFLSRSHFTPAQWRAYQTAQVRELLTLARNRIPFYQRAWRHLALDDASIASFQLEDLRSLPMVEKDAVRAEPEAFCVDGAPPPGSTICPTSGSTGTPVRVYVTDAEFRRSLALREARSCRPAGVSFRMPRATFSGRMVVPDPRSAGPFHRVNVVERQVYFSAFHLSPRNARAYVEPLRRHGIVWGTGYTHAWDQLAMFMLEQSIEPPASMRSIITTSEKLTPAARARIERAFNCRVFQEYGTVEDAVFASEHVDGRLRLSPDACVLELRRPDGSIIDETSSEEGETVTTSLVHRGQVLIRYRLGDVAAWDQQPDASGSSLPILADVVGRLEDVIEAPDGRRTVRFHGVFTELAGVREAQVIQEARDRVRILFVPSPECNDQTAPEIVARVQARLTSSMNVEVERVAAIPRTAAGKYKAVVNKLKVS